MYWALIMVSLFSPVEGIQVMDFGAYRTYDECQYALRELEIQMGESEGAMCLQVDIDFDAFNSEWWKSDLPPEELQ